LPISRIALHFYLFLEDKDCLLTYNNLLKHKHLCECLDDSIKIGLKHLASNNEEKEVDGWKALFEERHEFLDMPVQTINALRPLKYLPNIKEIILGHLWTADSLNTQQIKLIKNAAVRVSISTRNNSNAEQIRVRNLKQKLIANRIQID
jgi:hypothetical protein